MMNNSLIFKPYLVQSGCGPHLGDFVFATDENGDTFRTDIQVRQEGVAIAGPIAGARFGINVRWNVEGYGYLFMTADNGGDFYQLPLISPRLLNLNFELAKSRLAQNQRRYQKFTSTGWQPSRELQAYLDLSQEYLNDAQNAQFNPELQARFSQRALEFGLKTSELMEFEKAGSDIQCSGSRAHFLMGCDSRGYFQMNKKLFLERFSELFNYATITHYLIGDVYNFEPEEGKKQFTVRDKVLRSLQQRNISIEGRPLFWSHQWVTPEWLSQKRYPDLLKYLEKHVHEVIAHYGEAIQVWEVVNELHDWANELALNHAQTIEVTKLACEVARATNPRVRLLINNCCPFAHYVQLGKWHQKAAQYPQRTPHQFVQQLLAANVDFDIIGVQMYFTNQVLADTFQLVERYEQFGKTVHFAEVGATSSGVTIEFADHDAIPWSVKPYEWRRHWDEELQADWLEYVFTFAYSKPWIEAANWYDFVDPYGYLKNGGLLRSVKGEKKAAAHRLLNLKKKWRR